ncbi:hypothetical protein [Halorussus aquaticus]|nr:hypothetical protein [Halorussus aquaticus]
MTTAQSNTQIDSTTAGDSSSQSQPPFSHQFLQSIQNLSSEDGSGFGTSIVSVDLSDIREYEEKVGGTVLIPSKRGWDEGAVNFDIENIKAYGSSFPKAEVAVIRFKQQAFREALATRAAKQEEYKNWEIWSATEAKDVYAVQEDTVIRIVGDESVKPIQRVKRLLVEYSDDSDQLYTKNVAYADVADAVAAPWSMVTSAVLDDLYPKASFLGSSYHFPEPGRIKVVRALGYPSGQKPDKEKIRKTMAENSEPLNDPVVKEMGAALVASQTFDVEDLFNVDR